MTPSALLVDENPHFLRILDRFISEHSESTLRAVGSVVGGAGHRAPGGAAPARRHPPRSGHAGCLPADELGCAPRTRGLCRTRSSRYGEVRGF